MSKKSTTFNTKKLTTEKAELLSNLYGTVQQFCFQLDNRKCQVQFSQCLYGIYCNFIYIIEF